MLQIYVLFRWFTYQRSFETLTQQFCIFFVSYITACIFITINSALDFYFRSFLIFILLFLLFLAPLQFLFPSFHFVVLLLISQRPFHILESFRLYVSHHEYHSLIILLWSCYKLNFFSFYFEVRWRCCSQSVLAVRYTVCCWNCRDSE